MTHAGAPYAGLTWDHPRGYDALAASADGLIHWDVQPLEGFESHPIDDLCARYDLVVLDHPHLGEALGAGCLRPLDDLFTPAELARWGADSIGPTMRSYAMDGRQWALPLDAATQVAATRTDLADEAPRTWDEVRSLARRAPVALSLAGPHAFLTFASVAVALGEEPAADPDELIGDGTGLAALDLMAAVDALAPPETRALNPIGLLELMAGTDRLAHCPLVYGYVTYADRLTFTDAPTAAAGDRPGSTLGGTGIALSTRCAPSPELLDHVRWLMSPAAQRDFLPRHSGQPSARAAWTDSATVAADFYRRTTATCEQAWVRPRHAGYIGFQGAASAAVRAALAGETDHREALDRMRTLYRTSRTPKERHT
ncbi:extracellular solute-binding protein [Streptomyces olivaceus]|uniref:extracellular solute-binding protein n=1 Tax=Streptomyces TaxID=1883 RepID=UPI001CCC61B6|nr:MULTISPECIES: extracellular solute-binding protein [Streptomyces]MBZ6141418.1 extracellular solute-binding protein [Streptomyces olivaceus]MBZ6169182.1 extracellular solute-binding protein [Streptomyces olivaceus]MBZ6259550.1 extracellular solute-binding protein [Streptomyces olivaceus]MCU8594069.1 extracellular solute-binding protein [Streptomyces sp. A13(2022)]UOG81620.1 extracellular solute-binding protein [Streptomyces sp. CB09030]